MNVSKFLKNTALLSAACLAFGLAACGDDSSSSAPSDNPSKPSSSASIDDEGNDNPGDTTTSSSSSIGDGPVADQSSSSKKQQATETTSSEEALNEAKKAVTGSCAPEGDIAKGELATWSFFRSEGDVFAQIMAPFVWKFTGASQESVQGNGLQSVNIRYEKAGSYGASLTVDGNTIQCEDLLVKGIPISVTSCKPNKSTAYVGDQISWTVEATSESKITGYKWTAQTGSIKGTGTEASMEAPSGLHKEAVAAVVYVTNEDNTTEKHTCEGVTVLDPNHVDMVLTIGNSNDQDKYGEPILPTLPDSMFISGNTPTVVQIPAGAKTGCTIGCKPRVGADYMSTEVMWDSDEPVSNFAYFQPAGCAPGKTYTVTSSVNVLCLVQP